MELDAEFNRYWQGGVQSSCHLFQFNTLSFTQGLTELLQETLPHSQSQLTYFDLLTNIYLRKQFRRENNYSRNICHLLEPFQSKFYSHQSVTEPFDSSCLDSCKIKLSFGNTEVFHLDSCGDVFIPASHSVILKKQLGHWNRDLYLHESNNTVSYLIEYTVQRKSAAQIEELIRLAHEFILNRSVRLSSGSISTFPYLHQNCHPDHFNTKLNTESPFLDLLHELPFERTIFNHNATYSFQSNKGRVIRDYVRKFIRRAIVNGNSSIYQLPSNHDPYQPIPNPIVTAVLPLAVHCAIAIKRQQCNLDFTPCPTTASITKYFDHLGTTAKNAFSQFTIDLNTSQVSTTYHRFMFRLYAAQKHDRQMRGLFLQKHPRFSFFPFPKSHTINQLNSWYHFVVLTLVPTTFCEHILHPYNFDDFAPIHVRSLHRRNQTQFPMPLIGLRSIPDTQLSITSEDIYESSSDDEHLELVDNDYDFH